MFAQSWVTFILQSSTLHVYIGLLDLAYQLIKYHDALLVVPVSDILNVIHDMLWFITSVVNVFVDVLNVIQAHHVWYGHATIE